MALAGYATLYMYNQIMQFIGWQGTYPYRASVNTSWIYWETEALRLLS